MSTMTNCIECERFKKELEELETRYEELRDRNSKEMQRAQTLIGKLLLHIHRKGGVFMLCGTELKGNK